MQPEGVGPLVAGRLDSLWYMSETPCVYCNGDFRVYYQPSDEGVEYRTGSQFGAAGLITSGPFAFQYK